MNPWLIRIGISVAVSVATFLYIAWRKQTNVRNVPEYGNAYTNPGNYDGSSESGCCICLTEFKFLAKDEMITLPCKHKVCLECCKKMFSHQVRNHRNCPTCRKLISEAFVSRIF